MRTVQRFSKTERKRASIRETWQAEPVCGESGPRRASHSLTVAWRSNPQSWHSYPYAGHLSDPGGFAGVFDQVVRVHQRDRNQLRFVAQWELPRSSAAGSVEHLGCCGGRP
jgi:hypothetical protein